MSAYQNFSFASSERFFRVVVAAVALALPRLDLRLVLPALVLRAMIDSVR